ncbi:MAG TPA: ubiquitin-conjugating enzyme E2 [Chthonomonadaceae bacterium]|nr:ubiquitin-conjugating enzyme E2 [Chthonomonadaceae bacterium]
MPNARDLRLQSDYEHVRKLAIGSGGTLVIEATRGRPPDEYVLLYKCRSIEGILDGKPVYRDQHRVKIHLPAKYPLPSAPPRIEVLTPIFNPHVYPNREVCIGDWHTGEFLDELVLRLGALLQFDRRILNIRDPANEDAMAWVHKNMILFPTDDRSFRADAPRAASAPPDSPAEPDKPVLWVELT